MTADIEAAWLDQAAAQLDPSSGTNKAGALRTYLRAHYDAVLAIKESRQLSWGQIATLLQARGLTKTDGSPLDGNAVGVMAAQVRWERSPRSRQRRHPKTQRPPSPPPAAPSAPAHPMPTAAPDATDDPPRRRFTLPKTTRK
jgi:hypothetical protein